MSWPRRVGVSLAATATAFAWSYLAWGVGTVVAHDAVLDAGAVLVYGGGAALLAWLFLLGPLVAWLGADHRFWREGRPVRTGALAAGFGVLMLAAGLDLCPWTGTALLDYAPLLPGVSLPMLLSALTFGGGALGVAAHLLRCGAEGR